MTEDDVKRLAEIRRLIPKSHDGYPEQYDEFLLRLLDEERDARQVSELYDWREEDGDVLWWRFPIEEPPYVGSPLSNDWPGYHTHWTRIALPGSPR